MPTPRRRAAKATAKAPTQPRPGRAPMAREASREISSSGGRPWTSGGRRTRRSWERVAMARRSLGPIPHLREVADTRPGAELGEHAVGARVALPLREPTDRIVPVAEDDGVGGAGLLAGG